MIRAIHPNKMVLDHLIVRNVVCYLYHLSGQPLPGGAFRGKLTIWHHVQEGQSQIEIRCADTDKSFWYVASQACVGEHHAMSRFDDYMLRHALKALQWHQAITARAAAAP